ncbi:MAG: DOMON domain-containing protein [Pseudomonadota bacterium]
MDRRTVIAGLAVLGVPMTARADETRVAQDGTHLVLWHAEGRLHAQFSAPTMGWVAVGFNNVEQLKGTRFVIGAMRPDGFHAEEHIAVVPDHPTVQSLGLVPGLGDLSGRVAPNRTTMTFSLPHVFPDSENPRLGPDATTYLMLAWSHDKDFAHHSAWRRHTLVTL